MCFPVQLNLCKKQLTIYTQMDKSNVVSIPSQMMKPWKDKRLVQGLTLNTPRQSGCMQVNGDLS